jgi:pyruvate, orthophosphate dikinase
MSPSQQPTMESDALKANLLETAVDDVIIAPEIMILKEVVQKYKGILNNLDSLLYEISHPFRNWGHILPRLRTFTLKNLNHFHRHPKGPQCFEQFFKIYLEAIKESRKDIPIGISSGEAASLSLAIEALLAYIEKIVQALDQQELKRYESVLAKGFEELYNLDEQRVMHIVQGHHPIKRIAARLLKISGQPATENKDTDEAYDLTPVTRLLGRILTLNYRYWLNESDPQPWFNEQCEKIGTGLQINSLFGEIAHEKLYGHLQEIEIIHSPGKIFGQAELGILLEMPNHIDIVRHYKDIPAKLTKTAENRNSLEPDRFTENRKLIFLFRIMDTSGLYLIHEETLREINRTLVKLIHKQTFEEIERFLLTTLQLLKSNVRKYPHTTLQCIQVLGTEVFNRGNSRLVETFLWETVRFGFQYANVSGVDVDWQPLANPAHLANIRVWLNLIMQEPKWCSTLFSALIINLKLSGTCVKDTDLFQRDITNLLNHPVGPVFNLVKQFAKLMPVFFNEIGAEGALRDVSTQLDEHHKRKDILIHFLRKQSHVESSNLIVEFIEAILVFWRDLDKRVLEPYLPSEILAQFKVNGPYIDDMHKLAVRIFEKPRFRRPADLLDWDEHRQKQFFEDQSDLDEGERNRFSLLIQMYKLLYHKYNLGLQEIRHQLMLSAKSGFPEMEQLLADLEICDTFQGLSALFAQLENLKKIILSEDKFEVREDIYYKRHIAVDIPSVYGRYREKKFDALGLTFRLENLANIYLEKIPETVNLSFITKATFIRIVRCLRFFLRALKLDGITSRKLDTYFTLLANSLEMRRFSFTQYLDIFRGLSEGVKDVIYVHYTNIHQNNLSIIIPQLGKDNLLAKYRKFWKDNHSAAMIHQLSETFMRDLIATTFGLQHLDNFITRITQTLERQKELLDESSIDLLMTYNPEKTISFLHRPNPRTNNLIHLGNKGFNLALLASDKKPVPPGFIITTEIFRCWPVVKTFYKARDEFMANVRKSITELETITGRRYGDPANPLLFSVRSGATISMPGMMATIHNVGLNQDIVEECVQLGNEYVVWDNYRRFLQSWAMAKGMERESFQFLMNTAKEKYNVFEKKQFSSSQMKELALEYQKAIRNRGIGIPDDPWLQLIGAVEMVLDSWDTQKTKEYRTLMDVSESWGTAVIIQTMVFGNKSRESGSGVVFTAHPYRKVRRVALWGDYAPSDQGEDIVGGLVTTYPISTEQAEIDGRSIDNTLEKRFPEIYSSLLEIARDLVYEKQWNPQEIEFTFEGPKESDLFVLQTRDMITIKKKERFTVFESLENFEDSYLGKGIGVSGSAISGRAVFTVENIRQLRQEDPEAKLILLRQDTVPEDINEISKADGLLTARGGQTSHAAVVTLRLEKTCVVGCRTMKVFETEQYCKIGSEVIRFGDPVSIDGRKGIILKGIFPVKEEIHILPI